MNSDDTESLRSQINALQSQVTDIQSRNKRVEEDKAWETSLTRIVFLLIATYLITWVVFFMIGVSEPYLNAVIPTLGYLLSTQSLPLVKSWWLGRR